MKLIPLTYILLLTLPTLGSAAGNIDSTNKYAWSTNAGWVNFSPANGGVTVATDHLEGYAWAENVGWIKLGTYTGGGNHTYGNTTATDYGVNIDVAGNCSGYAWGTNIGWIKFNPTNGGVTVNQTTGRFDGYAWSENVGWIHFQNASPAYTVQSTGTSNVTVTSSTPPLPDYLGLFLQIDGTGHGKVTTNTGLFCHTSDCQVDPKTGDLKCNPQNCTQLEKTTSDVTLTPQADADSVFSSWGGNEDCVDGEVFMNSSKLCIAYFRRLYPLTITIQGAGLVQGFGWDQQPMGIDCGTECEATYSSDTTVYLQATPATGQEFLGWGGDCEGMQNPLAVEVTQETTCEARFGVREVPPAPATEPKPVTPEPGDTTTVTPPPVTAETTPVVPGTTETTPAKPETTETVPVVPETTETVTVVPDTTETVPVVPETTETVPVVPETTETAPVVPETATSPVTETPSPVVVSDTPAAVTTPTTVVLPPPWFGNTFLCATTGTIDQVCNYGGRSVTQLEVQSHGMVSNGVLTGMLVNTGWVSNFTITLTGKLSGGVVTGYIKNEGVMRDFEFRGASIVGGTLGGTLRNTSQIGGYFQDVTLLAGTKIIGGILKGTIKGDKKSKAVLEKVRVRKGSKLSGVTLGKGVVLEKGVVVEK